MPSAPSLAEGVLASTGQSRAGTANGSTHHAGEPRSTKPRGSRVELVDRPSSDGQADRAALQPRLRLLLLSGEGEPFPLRQRFRTADDLLEACVQRYIAATSAPEVEFTWQRGEPTLTGREFFERAVVQRPRFACRPMGPCSMTTEAPSST